MDQESKNIESWGVDATNRTRDQLAGKALDENERNRLWWEALPMTYDDWGNETRDPVTAEDFQRVDRHYFGTNPYLDEHVPFSQLRDKRVVEIGCGAGSAACRFASEGAHVLALDITAKAVELTQRHAVISGVEPLVTAQQADAEDLSAIEEGAFDYLYSWGVMHHSSKPEQCFAQVCRVLKPGGEGLIMVYHQDSLRYWLKGLMWLLLKGKIFKGDTFTTVQRFYTDGYYHKHYTHASLTTAMEHAGFTVQGIDVTHMSSRMIPFVPERLRQWLKKCVGWLIVARVKRPG
jgi:2-polyprenyl-3-methyl-5-hydroxy-6-metoxy-1,4-benzoquinol methylase